MSASFYDAGSRRRAEDELIRRELALADSGVDEDRMVLLEDLRQAESSLPHPGLLPRGEGDGTQPKEAA